MLGSHRLIVIALAGVLALSVLAGAGAQGPPEPVEPAEPETVNVEVRVWQRISNPLSIYISARPEGGSWATLGTIPLPLDDGFSSSGTYRYGDITVAGVEVRVWQRVSDPLRIQISARPEGGSWATLGTIPLPLDDGISSDGRYRYGDITVAVPLPDLPPEPVEPVDRSQCRIDEAMASRVIASTVKVITPAGTGSAFYVGNGEFVTAAHVVDDRPAWITLRNERINISASIVGYTSQNDGDLALLSASAPGVVALKWAGEIGAGAEVAVVGYPLGVGLNASISQGIVSRVFTDSAGVSQIQTDAPANPGNSGGPLVDACGRVAGVVSWKIASDRQGNATEGLAFVVGEPSLSRLLRDIRSGQYVPPANTPQEDSYLTITAFCTVLPSEDIDFAECDRRSTSLSLSGNRLWNIWAQGVENWDDVVYRFNEGATIRQSRVKAALQALGTGCHEIEIAEDGISTHWSVPYEFCFATGPAQPTWAQMNSLVDTIVELWNPTHEARSVLWRQWDAIISYERLPSSRLSGIALDVAELSLGTAEAIGDFAEHPALVNETVANWWLEAWGYWLAVGEQDLEFGRYARNEATWGAVLWMKSKVADAYAKYKRAECTLWQFLYTNSEAACDGVVDAERDAAEAEAEARAWRPPAVTPTPPAWTLRSIDGYATLFADDGTYLGIISSNRYQRESVCNEYGPHGSPYQTDSVRNEYGAYGSPYRSGSAYNPYTSNPPTIYLDGRAIGYLTKNDFLAGAVDPDILFATYDCVY